MDGLWLNLGKISVFNWSVIFMTTIFDPISIQNTIKRVYLYHMKSAGKIAICYPEIKYQRDNS